MNKLNKEELLDLLEERFNNKNTDHSWSDILNRLKSNDKIIGSLLFMENTGGEVNFWKYDKETDKYIFTDFSVESPKGRRSLCYDKEALEKRKANKPIDSAINQAEENGVKLLSEVEYRELQEEFNFDMKTSSWILTPDNIRKLGGALFCDRRYNHVFTYHNGADSYYASRGYRVKLEI